MTTAFLALVLAFGSDDLLEQARQRQLLAEQVVTRQTAGAALRAALAYLFNPRQARRLLKEARGRVMEDAVIRERHRARLAWGLELLGGRVVTTAPPAPA